MVNYFQLQQAKRSFFPVGTKNFAKSQNYKDEVKILLEMEIKAFENRVADPKAAPALETLAKEHAVVLVTDVPAHLKTLSMTTLDALDWWIDEVQKIFLSGRVFIFPQNVHLLAGFKNACVIGYRHAKRTYTNWLMISVDNQGIAKPMEIFVSTASPTPSLE